MLGSGFALCAKVMLGPQPRPPRHIKGSLGLSTPLPIPSLTCQGLTDSVNPPLRFAGLGKVDRGPDLAPSAPVAL